MPCAIRLIVLPVNIAILLAMLIITLVPLVKMPSMLFSSFVFWTLKPLIVVVLVLSISLLMMGALEGAKYDKCWQLCYSLFLMMLIVVVGLWKASNASISWSIENVIPTLWAERKYKNHLIEMARELDCFNETEGQLVWRDDETGREGCLTRITNTVGDFPNLSEQCCIAALVVLTVYLVMNLVMFFTVSDAEDDMRDSITSGY